MRYVIFKYNSLGTQRQYVTNDYHEEELISTSPDIDEALPYSEYRAAKRARELTTFRGTEYFFGLYASLHVNTKDVIRKAKAL